MEGRAVGQLLATPTERYTVLGRTVWVKREDLCAPPGAPHLAKMRGCVHRLKMAADVGFREVGCLDTRISVSAWATAYMAQQFGLHVVAFYPKCKDDPDEVPWRQARAAELGAEPYALPGGRNGVVYGRAKAIMRERGGYMMPMGLVLSESADAAMRQTRTIPPEARGGDVVLSVGSGVMLAGVSAGLAVDSHAIYGVSCGMANARQRSRAERVIKAPLAKNVHLLQSGYGYYDEAVARAPFPCNRFYDLKAWEWLVRNLDSLRDPILFWNIGSDHTER